MTDAAGDLEREWTFFTEVVDPVVNEVLAFDDPWDAYHRTLSLEALLTDTSPGGSFELPHAGGVFAAWATLTDVYDTGKTPISEAHSALRAASKHWLERPTAPTAGFIEQWVSSANDAVNLLFERDGDWWHEPRK